MRICVSHTISMGHRLPSYDGICASPHGHNVKVEAWIETAAFTDFKHVSAVLKSLLDRLDHAMVLHVSDPLLPVLREMKFRTIALSMEPSTEAIAEHVFNQLQARMLRVVLVVVHETDKYAAEADMPNAAVFEVWE